ncbi:MAG TPA: PAS domain S-box protein, partial [Roseiflexaceae bacterium]|nr:PAS domain S-box protein [Roseiflexaceae bacterium]
QHLLLSIAETTPDLINVWDVGARCDIFVNRATPTALGYSSEETERLGADNLAELLHPDDAGHLARIREHYRKLREGEIVEYEYRLRHANGDWRWFYSRALVLSWTHVDQPKLVVATTQDVTERKQAEEALTTANARLAELNKALQHSRDLLRTLFDTLQDGLLLLGQQGQILALNEAFAAVLGEPATLLVRQNWPALCASRQALADSSAWVLETLADGRVRRGRERLTLSNGAVRIFDIEVIPIYGADKLVEQVIVHAADVTERLQIEAQMIEQERFAANGRLAATIAHEVNTPLQAVESCLHLVERAESSRRAEYLQLAREEVIRVGRILQQLLDIFRPSPLTYGPIDINVLIGRVLLLTGSTLARQGIDVERNLMPELQPVCGHSDEITQVLLNLVINASHAMPSGGVLRVLTRRTEAGIENRNNGPGVIVEIADTGIGMSAELQSR